MAQKLISKFIPGRKFPFPKSLYAVEDALRYFVADKPHATVLDFFSGSGTTAHAVMRLNRQDSGRRRCISVTNNLTHAYLVTDSEEAFQEMAGQLIRTIHGASPSGAQDASRFVPDESVKVPNVIQLYRDYLENFVINKVEAG
ncbi:MAG: DNA methyltransferase [Pseudomonadota bacterium]|nr:DNA methyltransferase [Pseudomonadota bacterium]